MNLTTHLQSARGLWARWKTSPFATAWTILAGAVAFVIAFPDALSRGVAGADWFAKLPASNVYLAVIFLVANALLLLIAVHLNGVAIERNLKAQESRDQELRSAYRRAFADVHDELRSCTALAKVLAFTHLMEKLQRDLLQLTNPARQKLDEMRDIALAGIDELQFNRSMRGFGGTGLADLRRRYESLGIAGIDELAREPSGPEIAATTPPGIEHVHHAATALAYRREWATTSKVVAFADALQRELTERLQRSYMALADQSPQSLVDHYRLP